VTVHVPTAEELVGHGLAEVREVTTTLGNGQKRTSRWIWVSEAGHKMMGDAMRQNALEAIASGETAWVRPPSSGPVLQ
jgi:hypothetical protein